MKPLEYIGIPVSAREEIATHSLEDIGKAVLLALYCARKVNGGTIDEPWRWTKKEWLLYTGLESPIEKLTDEDGLWHWTQDGDLFVDLYNTEYEAKALARRNKGAKAIAARWAKQKNTDNQRDEYSSITQEIHENNSRNTCCNTSKDKISKDKENHAIIHFVHNSTAKESSALVEKAMQPKESTPTLNTDKPATMEEAIAFFKSYQLCKLSESRKEEEAMLFFSHFASQGWTKKSGMPITDWKAAARLWIQRAQTSSYLNTSGGSSARMGINKQTDYEI